MNENIQPYLAQIFEYLSRGNFVNENSSSKSQRKLYQIINENFEDVQLYFAPLKFVLEPSQNSSYYYFSRQESRYNLEQKLAKFYDYIDIMAFFADFNISMSEGFRFSVNELEQKCKVDTNLSDQLKAIIKEENNILDRVLKIVKMMTDRGFFECENEEKKEYKVLSSYTYLQDLVQLIDIEVIENEKPLK
ncbi:condensin complex protein MksE [Aureibacter tunicatorum]|uniref:Uncharacterized protein n=1 Tax=Aureibacter tunicatorum TaxID=866807 RepID=A0AAE3XMW0_9BACT|nr:hypothetical protein [Aureibacter tunicatorum]MDR6239420.1 hypothetical protein [Aureibacter tunicatorum]BDD04657.1 hypothetical protein AUTU_21400 [Aureibacter tunicatorum]